MFPLVITTTPTLGTTATASAAVSLPGGIRAGDLLVGIHRSSGAGAHGWPAGYNELADSTGDASANNTTIVWRKADGSEGATATVTQGNSKFASLVHLIRWTADPAVQPPEISTEVTGTSVSPDPGTCTPTGGAKDYLWLWLGGWENEQTSPPTGQPSGYSGPAGADSGTAGVVTTNCRVASAWRTNNASSENPGVWTISVSDDWTAWTMAVHPAGTPPPGPSITLRAVPHAANW